MALINSILDNGREQIMTIKIAGNSRITNMTNVAQSTPILDPNAMPIANMVCSPNYYPTLSNPSSEDFLEPGYDTIDSINLTDLVENATIYRCYYKADYITDITGIDFANDPSWDPVGTWTDVGFLDVYDVSDQGSEYAETFVVIAEDSSGNLSKPIGYTLTWDG
jgi:hypothetical protein